jgi:hypothetical protein
MTDFGRTPSGPENTVIGGGIINNGNFTGSPVTNVTGNHNRTVSSARGLDPLIEQLSRELDEARRLLEQSQAPERSADRDAAIAAIDEVREAAADQQASRDTGKLRRRLAGLIDALTPLMGIIEGIAACIEVFKNIKSTV